MESVFMEIPSAHQWLGVTFLKYTLHYIPPLILFAYIPVMHSLLSVSSVVNFSINESLFLAFLTPFLTLRLFSHSWFVDHIHPSVVVNLILPSCLSNMLSSFSFLTFQEVADCSEVIVLHCFKVVYIYDAYPPGLPYMFMSQLYLFLCLKFGVSSQETWWVCD